MNTAAIPARQLICLLQDTAAGQTADLAAVELIARHNHFLHQPAFHRVIAAGASILTGEPVVTIRWQAAITALEAGRLHATGSERAVLRIAASIGDLAPCTCARSSAASTTATSPTSPQPSPPPTANPPARPQPQGAATYRRAAPHHARTGHHQAMLTQPSRIVNTETSQIMRKNATANNRLSHLSLVSPRLSGVHH